MARFGMVVAPIGVLPLRILEKENWNSEFLPMGNYGYYSLFLKRFYHEVESFCNFFYLARGFGTNIVLIVVFNSEFLLYEGIGGVWL